MKKIQYDSILKKVDQFYNDKVNEKSIVEYNFKIEIENESKIILKALIASPLNEDVKILNNRSDENKKVSSLQNLWKPCTMCHKYC